MNKPKRGMCIGIIGSVYEVFPRAISFVKDVSSFEKTRLTTVITAKSGTILYSNARILHGIRRRRDVTDLSEERRQFLIKAVRAAETIVHMCLKSQSVSLPVHAALMAVP
jgi:hypothetical protein